MTILSIYVCECGTMQWRMRDRYMIAMHGKKMPKSVECSCGKTVKRNYYWTYAERALGAVPQLEKVGA